MSPIPPAVLALVLPLVERFEGCKLQSYQDPNGNWTIGYGHKSADVTAGMTCTQDEATAWLDSDVAAAYAQLLQSVPAIDTWSTGKQAAILDFVYNLGIGTFDKSSLHSAVLAGNWEAAQYQMSLWVHAGGKILPGLVDRREAEIHLIDA